RAVGGGVEEPDRAGHRDALGGADRREGPATGAALGARDAVRSRGDVGDDPGSGAGRRERQDGGAAAPHPPRNEWLAGAPGPAGAVGEGRAGGPGRREGPDGGAAAPHPPGNEWLEGAPGPAGADMRHRSGPGENAALQRWDAESAARAAEALLLSRAPASPR